MTGPASGVESTRASGGVRRRRSKTTRVSGRSRNAPRAVSSGIVGQNRAAADADGVHLGAHALRMAIGRRRRQRRPAAGRLGDAAVDARRRLEHDERPPLAHQREERLVQRDRRARRPARRPPSRRARGETRIRGRAPRGFGSSTAATTRATPASTMRLTHGPVRPWWQHGSSVQYSVAPRARAPASASACTSACASPARSWNPWPTTTPSADTTTAPTSGLGLVRPRAARRVKQRALHVALVLRSHHFSSNRPSTYSSAENGTRSSMPSPTPT